MGQEGDYCIMGRWVLKKAAPYVSDGSGDRRQRFVEDGGYSMEDMGRCSIQGAKGAGGTGGGVFGLVG
jgi:hypothetical protein